MPGATANWYIFGDIIEVIIGDGGRGDQGGGYGLQDWWAWSTSGRNRNPTVRAHVTAYRKTCTRGGHRQWPQRQDRVGAAQDVASKHGPGGILRDQGDWRILHALIIWLSGDGDQGAHETLGRGCSVISQLTLLEAGGAPDLQPSHTQLTYDGGAEALASGRVLYPNG